VRREPFDSELEMVARRLPVVDEPCALRVEHQPGAGREPRGVEGLRAEEADLLADGQHDLEVAVRQAALAQQA